MKPKPFSMVSGLAENTIVYVFNYAGDELDFETDKAAFITEFEKHNLINHSGGMHQHGIAITGSSYITAGEVTGINSRTLELSSSEDISGTVIDRSFILYKGVAIPYSDYLQSSGFVTTTCVTNLKQDSMDVYTSEDEGDYVLWLSDHLLGTLVSIEAPTVNLPIESNSFNAVGHDDPVIKVSKRGDPDASGSISVIESMTAIKFDQEVVPRNAPGEDLLSRVYGSEWTIGAGYAGNWNRLKAPTNPFGISIMRLSGIPYEGEGATVAGRVWATVTNIYHCRLTSITPPQNITGDSTDPILRGVEFECQYPDSNEEYVVYTVA
jgi:hypothetical protein